MKTPRFLLIYPPMQFMPKETPRPDGGLGLLYLVGALEDAGIEVDIVDAVIGRECDALDSTFYNRIEQENGLIRVGMSFERIAKLVEDGGYDVVGINSNFTPQTKMALEVAKAVKSVSRDIWVVVGGINARNMISYFLASGNIDFVAVTESEKIIVKLARYVSGNLSLDDMDGLAFLSDGKVVKKIPLSSSVFSENLDDLPIPRWNKLPLSRYAQVSGPHGDTTLVSGRIYAPIMTSRGCPFRCSFCHVSVEKEDSLKNGGIGFLRFKSVDRVVMEMEILKNLGVKRLYFEDDSLLAKKDRIRRIFGQVAGFGLSIADVNGVNLVHLLRRTRFTGVLEPDCEYLQVLKDAGFDQIVFSVESGSQRILDKYATAKLNLARMNVVELVRSTVGMGIECPINIMIGFPDETEAEILQSVELAKKLIDAGAKHCAFFIPTPFPGSLFFDLAVAEGYIDSCFDPDKFNIHNVCMRNTVVPPEKLIELREWAWRTVNRKDYVEARSKLNIGEN